MRIERLHLLAYGSFRAKILDFGKEPGFHLIYGPNEAGKSTTLRALTSVLFGFPHKIEDGYLYGSHDIQLGADIIAQDGRRLAFIRTRQRKNSLTLEDGNPVDEVTLASFLGGLSRKTFETVFSLNHDRLREHAQALLAEGGALGLGLAEAGSGISNLRKKLEDLSKERKEFFLSKGSTRAINQKIAKLSEIRKEIRARTVSPFEYKKYIKRIQELEEAREEARTTRDEIDRQTNRNERILRILPKRSEHEALSAKLRTLSDVEVLPPQAPIERIQAESTLNAAIQGLERVNLQIAEIQGQIQKISVDPRIIDHEEEIALLEKRSGAILKSMEDLPRRERELEGFLSQASALLQDAGLPDRPDSLKDLLPPLARQKHIASLIERRATLEGRIETARETENAAERELNRAKEELAATPETPDFSELEQNLSEADRLGDISSEIDKGRRYFFSTQTILSEKIRSLGLPSGDLSHLRELVLPPVKTVSGMQAEFHEIQTEEKEIQAAIQRLEEDLEISRQKIQQLGRTGDAATVEDLETVRTQRKEGWSLIRGRYLEGREDLEGACQRFADDKTPADRFEMLEREADRLADLLRTHAKESGELNALKNQVEHAQTQIDHKTRSLALCETRRKQFCKSWASLWPHGLVTIGSDGHPSRLPDAMAEWLKASEEILLEGDRLETQKVELSTLESKEREVARRLSAALENLDPDSISTNFESLRQKGRRVLDRIRGLRSLREKVEESLRSQSLRKKEASALVKELSQDFEAWKALFVKGLGEAGLAPSEDPVAVKSVLETLGDLNTLKVRIQEKSDQIEKMRQDHEEFSRDVARISEFLEIRQNSPLGTASLLGKALRTSREDGIRRSALEKSLDVEKENKARFEETIQKNKSLLATLCRQAKCQSVSDLPLIETRSKVKQETINALGELERHILSDGSGLSMEELFEECRDVSDDEIRSQLEDLKFKKGKNDKRLEQAVEELSTEKNALDARLSERQAGEMVQEAEFLKSKLGEEVEDYVALTFQEAILRRSIEIYRDRNQGPILMKAGDYFSALTEGTYRGIKADIDDKGDPILLAEHAERGSLEIPVLSDGTLDALYLALRLAAIVKHNASFEPVPFIADDLLINFDNPRAKATLKVLSDLSETGQVLFFTHHAHMKDLAQESVRTNLFIEHCL